MGTEKLRRQVMPCGELGRRSKPLLTATGARAFRWETVLV